MDPVVATVTILLLAVIAFISGKIPIGLVAVGVALALFLTGVLPLQQALAGFGDPTVLFIASLFVVSEALDSTGVTAWVSQKVVGRAGAGRGRLTLVVCVLVAALAAFISINGAVASLLPVVVILALRARITPSKMLIPLAFAASAGSLLTLAGTPVNPIVSEAAAAAGARAFGFFEFALVGVPLLVATVLFMVVFGHRLLPERTPDRFGVSPVDPSRAASDLRDSYGVALDTAALFTASEGVAEVMIPPRSSLIGRHVFAGMTTRDESLVILAVRRGERGDEVRPGVASADQVATPTGYTIRAGDAVLVQGPWDALERYVASPDVIPVTSTQSLRRAVPLGLTLPRRYPFTP